MRIALAFIVVILGANIGLSVVNKFQEIQDNRLDKSIVKLIHLIVKQNEHITSRTTVRNMLR